MSAVRRPVILGLLLAALTTASGTEAARSATDGTWWTAASDPARRAFLSGYFDCHIYDANARGWPDDPRLTIADRITSAYSSRHKRLDTPVISILETEERQYRQAHRRADEPHGMNDGDMWRQISYERKEAFVRGYLECATPLYQLSMEKSYRTIVQAVSRIYGTSDTDPGIVNWNTADRKIADVIVVDVLGRSRPNKRLERP